MAAMEARSRLLDALGMAEGLPCHDVASISVLLEAGEESIALEALCTQIYEYDVEVNNLLRAELVDLGRLLGVHAAYLLGDPWADSSGGCASYE